MEERQFKLRPSLPDKRDWGIDRLKAVKPMAVPPKFEHEALAPSGVIPMLDQGNAGTCGPHSLSYGICQAEYHATGKFDPPSILQIYYGARLETLNPDELRSDTGVTMALMYKGVKRWGAASEKFWSYDDRTSMPGGKVPKFAQEPPGHVWADARNLTVRRYIRLKKIDDAKRVIFEGAAPNFGIIVYKRAFDQAGKTGLHPAKAAKSDQVLGGHALTFYGWDDTRHDGVWKVRNSWGSNWGNGGCFLLPYAWEETMDWFSILTVDQVKLDPDAL